MREQSWSHYGARTNTFACCLATRRPPSWANTTARTRTAHHLSDSPMNNQKLYDRLIARMRKDDSGCWIWTGSAWTKRPYAANRYGYISWIDPDTRKQKCRGTHRAMWIALHGPLTREQEVCHRCDIPLCINPDHLFIGTHKDNMADSRAKGRHYLSAKTVCKRGHSLAPENVYVDAAGCRHCNECTRLRMKNKYRTDPQYRERQKADRRQRREALRNVSPDPTVGCAHEG